MLSATYVIAEAGVNHNGDLSLAERLVDAAADAGADAIKFQTFSASKLASASAPKATYQLATDSQTSQLAMLQKLELPLQWHPILQKRARARGLDFLSTPFDRGSLDFLLGLGMRYLKVPSGELVNAPLIWQFARSGLPMLVSTGMATLGEVEQALAVVVHAFNHEHEPANMLEVWKCWSEPSARAALHGRVTLLHCTSQYPTPLKEVNLRSMDTLTHGFGLPVGYSDHTEGTLVPVAAVARGACVLEKHLTLDRALPGPDHKASLIPDEFATMVRDIRQVERLMGSPMKATQASEWNTRSAARQQVVTARPIKAGQQITRHDLDTARCGEGMPAHQLWDLVGRHASRDYAAGDAVWE
jgi:N-acetylneuraminate synthase